MTTADGSILGTTKIVDNGPSDQRWDLVLMGDGYQATQMTQYAADVQRFVDTMFQTPPFDELRSAINVHRVDVTSTDSGADDPSDCGGSGATARTYFDATFCGNNIRRLLLVNDDTALDTADDQVPQWNVVLVVVNSTVYGGSGGTVGTFSLASGADQIALHELGHTAFGLADEYEYYRGCGVDTDRNNHPNSEPAEANVTVNTNRATLKWRRFVAASTAVPTTNNADCTQCDPQASPVPVGTVGLFEGAHYYHCDSYRPEFNCMMRVLGQPFCAVCRERIRTVLAPFLPAGRVLVADFGDGNPPAEVRYWENWGQSTLLNGWHDAGDLQLVGDYRGLGCDQVLFINRGGSGGRVMIADFGGGVPAQVRYWENWGQDPLLNGWHDSEDLQLVGDFTASGHDEVLFVNRTV
jgi:IgA peptidase M64